MKKGNVMFRARSHPMNVSRNTSWIDYRINTPIEYGPSWTRHFPKTAYLNGGIIDSRHFDTINT
jgi:hypothetical protein